MNIPFLFPRLANILPVLADTLTTDDYLNQMGENAFSLYKVLGTISFFLIVLSIASFGYSYLMSTFFGRADIELNKIKRVCIYIFEAAIIILVLPTVIGWAKGIVLPNAWEPPTGLEPLKGEYVVTSDGNSTPGGSYTGTSSQGSSGGSRYPVTGSLLGISGGTYKGTYTGQKKMDYYAYVPDNARTNMPLIIFLHGSGEVNNIAALENYGPITAAKAIYGNEYPFIMINACTPESTWTSSSITDTLKGLIDKAVSDYQCDPNRIIITGHSLGAQGVWQMVSLYGDYFSAACPVSGVPVVQLDAQNCAEVPIQAYYGGQETKYTSGMTTACNTINSAGGNATLSVMSGLDHAQTKDQGYTQDIFDWMLAQ